MKPHELPGDSRMIVHGRGFILHLAIESAYPKRFRRSVLLSLFRHVKDQFAEMNATMFSHDDSTLLDQAKDLARPVSLHQALRLLTSTERQGFALRVKRLKFGATQAEIAVMTGIARTHLSGIEHGHFEMTPITRRRLEHAFRVLKNRGRHDQTIAQEWVPGNWERAPAYRRPKFFRKS